MTLTRLAPFAFVGLALAASGCHHSHGGGASSAPAANDNAPLTEAGIAIPIAPGKTEAWRSALLELLGPRYAEYESSRERFGLTSQMTFLQRTPMGDFACLIHMTGADVRASFHAMSTSKDPWDVKWRTLTQDLHGFDFGQGAKVTPTVVPLYGMDTESKERGSAFMFLAPLGPDGAERLRTIAPAIAGGRHADYVRARAAIGVHREAAFLESTGRGDALVVYWLADDPVASLRSLAASRDPFDEWLRGEAEQAHPIPFDAVVDIASKNALIATYPH